VLCEMRSILKLTRQAHSFGGFRAFSSALPTAFNPNLKIQDKLLFTPGPLTTSYATKLAAMNDMGSRDGKFIQIIKDVRSELLKAANVSSEEFCTIIMQGSGTFGVESVISSVVNGTLLIIANGSYGKRMSLMAAAHNIPFKLM